MERQASRKSMALVRDSGKFKQKHRVKAHTLHARAWLSDPYFTLLEASWFQLLLSVVSGYAFVIVVAWMLTIIDVENVAGEPDNAPPLLRAFLFSMTNVLTMGFGSYFCDSTYLYFVATLQQALGMFSNVLLLTIVVTKFQRPHSDVIFSNPCSIIYRDGVPTLIFRIGNLRCNLVYHPEFKVSIMRKFSTSEGESFMRSLPLEVNTPAVFSGAFTVAHEITDDSPLSGFTSVDDLLPFKRGELVVTCVMMGRDNVYHDDLLALHRYDLTTDLQFSKKFADIMGRDSNGKPKINFDKFHDMVPTNSRRKKKQGKKDLDSRTMALRPMRSASLMTAPEASVSVVRRRQGSNPPCPPSKCAPLHSSKALRDAIALKAELEKAGELDAATVTVLDAEIRTLKQDWLRQHAGPASTSMPRSAAILAPATLGPHALLPTTNMAFEAIDGMQEFPGSNGPSIDPEIGYLLFGSSRRNSSQPLEPYCSFCTLAHLILRKIGMPLRVILIEIGPGFERPEWVRRHTRAVGCEKCDVPTLLYKNSCWGTQFTKEIIDNIPKWFPFESRTMCAVAPHLPKEYVDTMTKQLVMGAVARLKKGGLESSRPPGPTLWENAPFFHMLDATTHEPPPFDPEQVYLLYGSVRLAAGKPLEPVCSFCTYIAMALTKMGVPYSVILVELDVERPKWIQDRSGSEKPDVPLLFYKGGVYGTKSTQEIVDKLPELFPQEAKTSQIMALSPHLDGGASYTSSILKQMFMRTIGLLKKQYEEEKPASLGVRSSAQVGIRDPVPMIDLFDATESALQHSDFLSGTDVPSFHDCVVAIQVQNAFTMERILEWKYGTGAVLNSKQKYEEWRTSKPKLVEWVQKMKPLIVGCLVDEERAFALGSKSLAKKFAMFASVDLVLPKEIQRAAEAEIAALPKPGVLLPSFVQAYTPVDAHRQEMGPFNPDSVYLLFGGSRRSPNKPVEPTCSFCTYIAMTLRKMGVPFAVIFVEIGVPRPKWIQDRSGSEKPDVPLLFYKGGVYGTKSTQEIVDKLPELFPQEAKTSQIMALSSHVPENYSGGLFKSIWMDTVGAFKAQGGNPTAVSESAPGIFEKHFRIAEAALSQSRFLSGSNQIGFVDCLVVVQARNAACFARLLSWESGGSDKLDLEQILEVVRPSLPNVCDWMKRMKPLLDSCNVCNERFWALGARLLAQHLGGMSGVNVLGRCPEGFTIADAAEGATPTIAAVATEHPFASVFGPIEEALNFGGSFLSNDLYMTVADCQAAVAFYNACILARILEWPTGGGAELAFDEQLRAFDENMPQLSAWMRRMLPHLRTCVSFGERGFILMARALATKLSSMVGTEISPPPAIMALLSSAEEVGLASKEVVAARGIPSTGHYATSEEHKDEEIQRTPLMRPRQLASHQKWGQYDHENENGAYDDDVPTAPPIVGGGDYDPHYDEEYDDESDEGEGDDVQSPHATADFCM